MTDNRLCASVPPLEIMPNQGEALIVLVETQVL